MKLLEERVSKLEIRNQYKVKKVGDFEKAKECVASMHGQNERLRLRLIEVKRRMEGEERSKRKKNVIIKGMKVDTEQGDGERDQKPNERHRCTSQNGRDKATRRIKGWKKMYVFSKIWEWGGEV